MKVENSDDMETWTLLDTGVRSAAENSALDDVLLKCRNRDIIPNTLRFLKFSPNAVLVGFHQSTEQEVRIDYCSNNEIDINRRITGGGAIYLDEPQLGWELIASIGHPGIPKKVDDLYEKLCLGTVKGLQKLGVKAEFRPKNDIEVDGRKISGTGGAFEGSAFLFQGTLLTDFDVDTMLRSLRIPIEKLKD
ncbi:MAG: lipoate--protein ligase family protein, partial [bacterium]|nr:lipoate--protein ligase family protein [bacterium]